MENLDIKKNLVSIILPTYNRISDLKRAINSVFLQTYKNWELIIIDNNSNDGTEAFIKSLNDPRIIFILINNQGQIAISRNKGIEISKGEYIAFLDSDDWWKNNKLEISLNNFVENIDLVYHDLFIVKKLNRFNFYLKKTNCISYNFPVYMNLLEKGNHINNSSVVVRKSVIEKINNLPINPFLNSICDFHAWIEISKKTNNFKKIDASLGYYWLGGGNTTNPLNTINSLTYFRDNILTNNFENLNWLNYSLARSYYLIGDKHNFNIQKNKLLKAPKTYLINLKLLYMNFILYFK